jgi:hypothetical protein
MKTDWAAALGDKHGARERAAQVAARTSRDEAASSRSQALARWTRIVAAMTGILRGYNAAFHRDVLSIADTPSNPGEAAVLIQAGADAEPGPSLRASLEGTLICVRGRDADGTTFHTEFPLQPDRDDDQTAGYILRRWMERL